MKFLLSKFLEKAYIVSSRDMSPKGDAQDMHGREERGCVFSVPCCDSPPSLQVKGGVFYLVAKFVKLFIKGPLGFSIFFLGGTTGVIPRDCA